MKYIPQTASLAESIFRDIDKNEYLNELYASLLYNYSIELFDLDRPPKSIQIKDALRFADLLSKSTYEPTADRDHQWGQELATLLRLIYPSDEVVKYYLGSVLSAIGNYRGLEAPAAEGFQSIDILDGIFYEFDKENHLIPGKIDEYFFHDQKSVFDNLNGDYFSYSGPTSMGKSFVVQTYIQQQIEMGSTNNFAILVPTKALINEVRSNIFDCLQKKLDANNYKVVSAIGEIYLQQKHHFIFIMTPERLHHLLVERNDIQIDFLFVDEAHKISERGGRSTYYYKVISQLKQLPKMPTVIFASPNIPNPEIYLKLIPGASIDKKHMLTSRFAPVSQFKFLMDLPNHQVYVYNDCAKSMDPVYRISADVPLARIIQKAGKNKQNLVYCSSRQKVVDFAMQYAKGLNPVHNSNLKKLAEDIRNEVHKECYLADLIELGVAYHVGYLPANIRLRIEKCFEEGDLKTIFCTSTLIEGVNLPADNLFITSYRNGTANMDEVEFKNLVGRVGRIKYNLYGNVFVLRMDKNQKEGKYKELITNEVPAQKLSIDLDENKLHIPALVSDLTKGDIEMTECRNESKDKDFEALRKFALILTNDYASGDNTPVTKMFDKYVEPEQKKKIIENFPLAKTSNDITLSYDQATTLSTIISQGAEYPELKGENDDVDFEEVVRFLKTLSGVFKWNIYERETIGRSTNVLRWYANILLQWIRGNGLRAIINSAIAYKEEHPETGVWIGNNQIAERYNKEDSDHKNYVIAETLGVIENILLFSISNYFRKFSLEYKAFHGVDHFENDWYEFVEYGTTNELPRFLQRVGFTRDSAIFLELPNNQAKYISKVGDEFKVRNSVHKCGNASVEMDARDIQFNMPELFID
jgi:hypothetical protein